MYPSFNIRIIRRSHGMTAVVAPLHLWKRTGLAVAGSTGHSTRKRGQVLFSNWHSAAHAVDHLTRAARDVIEVRS